MPIWISIQVMAPIAGQYAFSNSILSSLGFPKTQLMLDRPMFVEVGSYQACIN